MHPGIIIAVAGLGLAIMWFRSAKKKMEAGLRAYYTEVAKCEVKRLQSGTDERKEENGNTTT